MNKEEIRQLRNIARAGTVWKPEEDELVRKTNGDAIQLMELAVKLKRTWNSVKTRYYYLYSTRKKGKAARLKIYPQAIGAVKEIVKFCSQNLTKEQLKELKKLL